MDKWDESILSMRMYEVNNVCKHCVRDYLYFLLVRHGAEIKAYVVYNLPEKKLWKWKLEWEKIIK